MADLPVAATIMVTTRNRKDDLRGALQSAIGQSVPVEILVVDDGSTDGTAEMVRREFPSVRLIRHEASRGYIVRRNEGAEAASGRVVFSIDDDAALSTPHIVEQTLRDFDDERIGAVAIPYIDVHRGPGINQQSPDGGVFATDRFIGTAHAVRRDVFLAVNGYRDALVHQGEEGDFCLRMLDRGFVVRLGTADPVHHFESPRRDFRRMDFFGPRNAVLFVWQNVPVPYVWWHLPITVVRLALHTLHPRRLATRLAGLVAGLALTISAPRQPVSRRAYLLARELAAAPRRLASLDLFEAGGA